MAAKMAAKMQKMGSYIYVSKRMSNFAINGVVLVFMIRITISLSDSKFLFGEYSNILKEWSDIHKKWTKFWGRGDIFTKE